MAGSRDSGDGISERVVAVELFLCRVFFNCLFPSDVIEKLNMMAVGPPGGWTRWDRR